MIAKALGANVIAVDIAEDKLAFARSIGAAWTVNASTSPDVVQEIRDITGGGAHVSLDGLGSPVTSFNSVSCLRKRGKHIQVGLMLGDHKNSAVPMDRIVAHELEILGSHGIQAYRYPDLLGMIATGALEPARLIRKRISLEQSLSELTAMDRFDGIGITVIDRF